METLFLEITASANRRRAGFTFREGRTLTFAVSDLSKQQIDALKADPVLNVRENGNDAAGELDETARANAVAEFIAGLDADAKAKGNPPTVKEATAILGFKPKGDELKAAWDEMKKPGA